MATDGITFGWFLPSSGDTTCLADPAAKKASGSVIERRSNSVTASGCSATKACSPAMAEALTSLALRLGGSASGSSPSSA